MTVKKFNYVKFIIFIVVLVALIVGIIVGIVKFKKHLDYKKSYEYKLVTIGYSLDEVKILEGKLSNKYLDEILTKNYIPLLAEFVSEKYFIYDNLEKYVEYKNDNKNTDNTKIVAIINTEANIDWFDNEKETDTSKGELMLVNRLYGLNSEYEVEDIVSIPSRYAYSGKKISESILPHIQDLIEEGRENGYTFVVSNGYRSYKEQASLYNSYANSYGKNEADKNVARPGHSEYETGLSFDLVPYNKELRDPKSSDEYIWLRENAHKYGFIFRFDADKEYLTGFEEFTWRLRYVGEEAATLIYNENICFEEYYAYFVGGER